MYCGDSCYWYGVVDLALDVVGIAWSRVSYSVGIHIELFRDGGDSYCSLLLLVYLCTVCENMSKPVPSFRPAVDHEA